MSTSSTVVKPYVSKKKRKLIQQEKDESNKIKLSKVDVKSFFITSKVVWERSQNPKYISPRQLCAHKKVCDSPIWEIKWCPKFAHLLAVTNGNCVSLYNAVDQDEIVLVYNFHDYKNIVRSVDWSTKGRRLATCAYDNTVKVIDFLNDGKVVLDITVDKRPNVIRWWKNTEENLLLVGGDNNYLKSFDIRTGKEAVNYPAKCGNVISIDFLTDSERFIVSGDLASRQSAEHSIAIWDIRTGAKLSEQMYHERYSCPCVRAHPSGASFLAQTNGDYIARFTTHAPYRMDKTIRYENHKVAGFPVQFDISADGSNIATGCSTGSVNLYQYKSSALLKTIPVTDSCSITGLAWNPVLSNVIAAGDWNGSIHVIK